MSAKDWSEWQWAFLFSGVENWLQLRIMCGTKRLNPFFRLHEASYVLNKYVMKVWSDNFTAVFFVSFIVPVYVPDSDVVAQLCPPKCLQGPQWWFQKNISTLWGQWPFATNYPNFISLFLSFICGHNFDRTVARNHQFHLEYI